MVLLHKIGNFLINYLKIAIIILLKLLEIVIFLFRMEN